MTPDMAAYLEAMVGQELDAVRPFQHTLAFLPGRPCMLAHGSGRGEADWLDSELWPSACLQGAQATEPSTAAQQHAGDAMQHATLSSFAPAARVHQLQTMSMARLASGGSSSLDGEGLQELSSMLESCGSQSDSQDESATEVGYGALQAMFGPCVQASCITLTEAATFSLPASASERPIGGPLQTAQSRARAAGLCIMQGFVLLQGSMCTYNAPNRPEAARQPPRCLAQTLPVAGPEWARLFAARSHQVMLEPM